HIARQPVPPGERLNNVPRCVSAIIMKLLAKTAEERYQTAVGAERDLRRCLAQWETQRRIDDFPLGERDTPDRLLIPEKLYGRASEIDTLLASFDRVVAGESQSWCSCPDTLVSASHPSSTSSINRLSRPVAFSRRASLTSTSATSHMPRWRRPFRVLSGRF